MRFTTGVNRVKLEKEEGDSCTIEISSTQAAQTQALGEPAPIPLALMRVQAGAEGGHAQE